VWGLQVTNEVNFTVSPDSSDGAYAGARDALIAGVEAAHAEAAQRGFRRLRIGFNWFYRMDPASEAGFWTYLHDHGGPGSCTPSTGWAWTRTPARSSRRPSHPAAIATRWSTR
jgi:hypothetical protein